MTRPLITGEWMYADPPALLCLDGCRGCREDEHVFGDAYRFHLEQRIAELETTRDRGMNPCMNCGGCGRDGEGE